MMSIAVQRRRGGSTDHANFTGFDGEVTVDTDKNTLVVHDGNQLGGYPLAREDMTNVQIESTISNLNLAKMDMSNVSADAIVSKGIAKTDLSNIDSGLLGSAASKDVGTAAGNVVQLDASGKLPAIDGSQLIGVATSGGEGSGTGMFTKSYDSGFVSWTTSGINTYAHGFGEMPKLVVMEIKFKQAVQGWQVGDIVYWDRNYNYGMTNEIDDTNIKSYFSQYGIRVHEKGSPGSLGSDETIYPPKCDIRVRAYA